jgi:hypothetical protein
MSSTLKSSSQISPEPNLTQAKLHSTKHELGCAGKA